MIVVIIAGGAGSRLWPLSTPNYPKHLLKINGSQRSLLQSTYDRASKLSDQIFVVSDDSHVRHVREQLPELPKQHILSEPDRRGTASCIVAALAKLTAQIDEQEPIAFVHSDHYIRDTRGFLYSFNTVEKISSQNKQIVLVGIEPDQPATIYGYIQKGELALKNNLVFKVRSFKEKPGYELAKKYLKSGDYLWNCGYFVGSLEVFIRAMQENAHDLYEDYQELLAAKNDAEFRKVYLGLKNRVIELTLIEKMTDLLVVPATFDWMDVGSYGDMHKAVESDESGNHVHGKKVATDCATNSFIQNHEDKPVVVVGLDNVVVINSPNGVLVARKDLSKKIGEAGKAVSAQE
jgi:mannose-1-phosphate guanylyltransferase